MKFKLHELYYVEWLDHCSDIMNWDWKPGEDMEPCLIKTVGHVVKDHEDYVVLGMSLDRKKSGSLVVSGQMSILKVCIKKRKKLVIE